MPWVANVSHGILGGKKLHADRTPGEAWRCEYIDPETGTQCQASGDTKRNSGVAPFRHDCRGHGAERGEFRRAYYACARHWQQFMREHAAGAITFNPGMVGASGRGHSR